ncbi:MAG: ABC transporter substrate-binding protein/permease [Leuconostoc gelidum]|jgi:His/Glu/Gln/Arg/opine family amino acid ABC transporter permease subunit|uniref:ABC transporter substrate-binding protein/permease n=1 Tax=Leuconostoc gelidum subsp. gelidum TaxID=1607839 RepID=A0ABS7V4T5_LEUGE|nr:ABC transporter substrate-binding protein/permease [Leuconostoc gelidum]AFS40643.1 amino acid ABC transporter [Leuconostoc gelidum JB7]MBZ5963773.1 ABC transporter substrate-binding protein/permease [Leuconostoc gelidum subsp. gelidum]MBZ5975384.1 ABC transporter substrate-binding protein/permease [Leuconostoc gelidum subsp. gelidum]MBZ5976445.1 ABC transporter substrate-binding protein/permease [Leuconostoc gelidum subsp. gelidum]MBZ5978540.1 ABC transporter substrate-binding protein/perme
MVHKIVKKLVMTAMGLILLLPMFLVFVPQTQAADTDPAYTAIKKRGVLIVGLSADYAPFEFHATVGGRDQIVGFEVSMAKQIAKDLGVKIQIKEMGFDGLIGAVQTGKIDVIISGINATPEREKVVDFSKSYMSPKQTILILKKNAPQFTTNVDSFSGKKVGAQRQTTQETFVQNNMPSSTLVSIQKVPDLVSQLSAGKISGVVLNDPISEAYAQQNKALQVIYPKPNESEGAVSIAMRKNSPVLQSKINASIDGIVSSGKLKAYQKEANTLMFAKQSFWAKYGNLFIKGTLITLALAAIAVVIGAVLGTVLALFKLSPNFILKSLGNIYIEYVRGTPLLVQAFMVFFGTQVIGLNLSAFAAGALAMGLNSAAYVAEIIRSGINSVNYGQTEAARSLGLSKGKSMRYIILPQAIKNILPALGNEFVTVIKEGSVVSVIGVGELMFQTGVVQGASFQPFFPLLITSLIYFVLTFSISRALGYAEKRMARSSR